MLKTNYLPIILLACYIFSCQTATLSTAPTGTQDIPSPTPTVASSHEPLQQEVEFSLNNQQPCIGEKVVLSILRSNLGRGSIPIVLTPGPEFDESTPSVPGGNKRPLPLIEDMAVIGQMPVSPTGIGTLTFTLSPDYITPSGKKISIDPNKNYLLYWEPRLGALSSVASFKACS